MKHDVFKNGIDKAFSSYRDRLVPVNFKRKTNGKKDVAMYNLYDVAKYMINNQVKVV